MTTIKKVFILLLLILMIQSKQQKYKENFGEESIFLAENENYIISEKEFSVKTLKDRLKKNKNLSSNFFIKENSESEISLINSSNMKEDDPKLFLNYTNQNIFVFYNFYFHKIHFKVFEKKKFTTLSKLSNRAKRNYEKKIFGCLIEISQYNFKDASISEPKKIMTFKMNKFFFLENSVVMIKFIDNIMDGYLSIYISREADGKDYDIPKFDSYDNQNDDNQSRSKTKNNLENKFIILAYYHHNFFKPTLNPKNIELSSFSVALKEAIIILITDFYNKNPSVDILGLAFFEFFIFVKKKIKIYYLPKNFKKGINSDTEEKELYFVVELFSQKVILRMLKDKYFLTEVLNDITYNQKISLMKKINPRYNCFLDNMVDLNLNLYFSFLRFKEYEANLKRISLECDFYSKNFKIYSLLNYKNMKLMELKKFAFSKSNDFKNNLEKNKMKMKVNLKEFFDIDYDRVFKESGKEIDSAKSNKKIFFPKIERILEKKQNFFVKNDITTESKMERNKKSNPKIYFDEAFEIESNETESEIDSNKVKIEEKPKIILSKPFSTEIKDKSQKIRMNSYVFSDSLKDSLTSTEKYFYDNRLISNAKFEDIEKLFVIKNKINTLSILETKYSEKKKEIIDSDQIYKIDFKIVNEKVKDIHSSTEMFLLNFDLEKRCLNIFFKETIDFHFLICLSFTLNLYVFSCNKFYKKDFDFELKTNYCFDQYGNLDQNHPNYLKEYYHQNKLVIVCREMVYLIQKKTNYLQIKGGKGIKGVKFAMEGSFKKHLSLNFLKNPNPLNIYPTRATKTIFSSFYSPQYLLIDHFTKGNLVEVNIINTHRSNNKMLVKHSSKLQKKFEFIKAFCFESRYYFGDMIYLNLFGFLQNVEKNDIGEIKDIVFQMVISNEDDLVYHKPNHKISQRDKIFFYQKIFHNSIQSTSLDKKKQSHMEFSDNPNKDQFVFMNDIENSILSGFENFKTIDKLDYDIIGRKENYHTKKEITGLKPVFQKKIIKKLTTLEGILYQTENENNFEYIHQLFDHKFIRLSSLYKCLNVTYLIDIRSLLCHTKEKLELYDFENERINPRKIRFYFKNQSKGMNNKNVKDYVLYTGKMGDEFPYTVFYKEKDNELHLIFTIIESQQYFELRKISTIKVPLSKMNLKKFFIQDSKLILISKNTIIVYYLDIPDSKIIFLKKNMFENVYIDLETKFDMFLLRHNKISKKSNDFQKQKVILMLAKKYQKINSIDFKKKICPINMKRSEVKEKKLWKAVFEKIMMRKTQGTLGVLTYNVDSSSASSFESFIPLNSLFKKNKNSSIFLKQEEMNKEINVQDIVFFKNFYIFDRDDPLATEKAISGVVIVQKINQKKMFSSNSHKFKQTNYLNKYSFKFILPVQPVIKLDLLSEKKETDVEKIIQFGSINIQKWVDKNNSKRKHELIKDIKNYYMNKINQKKSNYHKFVEPDFIQIGQDFSNKLFFWNKLKDIWNDNEFIKSIVLNSESTNQEFFKHAILNLLKKHDKFNLKKENDKTGYYINQDLLKAEDIINPPKSIDEIKKKKKTEELNISNLEDINFQKDSEKQKNETKQNVNLKWNGLKENKLIKWMSHFVMCFWPNTDLEEENILKNENIISINQFKKIKNILIKEDLIPKNFVKVFENDKIVQFIFNHSMFIKGNVTSFKLVMDFFPDNYHPLVSIKHSLSTEKVFEFPKYMLKFASNLRKSKEIFVFQSGSDMSFCLVTKKTINLFGKKNNLIQSVPKSVMFWGRKREINSYIQKQCIIKSIRFINLLFFICFQESHASFNRKHSVKINGTNENKRKKNIIYHQLEGDKLLQKSIDDLLQIFYSIDFDDYFQDDKFVYFYKKDKYHDKVIMGDFQIYEKKIFDFLNTDKRFELKPIKKISNFFFKMTYKINIIESKDYMIVCLPMINIENRFLVQLEYYSELQKMKINSFFEIKNIQILNSLKEHLNSFEIKIAPFDEFNQNLIILFILPNQIIYYFGINRKDLEKADVSKTKIDYFIEFKMFGSTISGLKSGELINSVFLNRNYIFTAVQVRNDVIISITNFVENGEIDYLNSLNIQMETQPTKNYSKIQKIFSNKRLLNFFLLHHTVISEQKIMKYELKMIFSDSIQLESVYLDYILEIQKTPFKSKVAYLSLYNNFDSRVIPLNLKVIKDKYLPKYDRRNHSNLFVLFFISFFVVLLFKIISICESYFTQKKNKKKKFRATF